MYFRGRERDTLLFCREKKNTRRRRRLGTGALTFVAPRPYAYVHTHTRGCVCVRLRNGTERMPRARLRANRVRARQKFDRFDTSVFLGVNGIYRLLSLPPPTGRSRRIHKGLPSLSLSLSRSLSPLYSLSSGFLLLETARHTAVFSSRLFNQLIRLI